MGIRGGRGLNTKVFENFPVENGHMGYWDGILTFIGSSVGIYSYSVGILVANEEHDMHVVCDVCFIFMMYECFIWSCGSHSQGRVSGIEETSTRH